MTDEAAEAAWESQTEVDAVLAETGATMNKLPRWRREGLLSKEIDWRPRAYNGSAVRYPKGTCEQIRAIVTLFKEKIGSNTSGFGFGGSASRSTRDIGARDFERLDGSSTGLFHWL